MSVPAERIIGNPGEDVREITQKDLATQQTRLASLYKVLTDKDAQGRPLTGDHQRTIWFRPNVAQWHFYRKIHEKNVILKARRLGFSTFIQIFMLDCVFWAPNLRAAIIADTQAKAWSIFADRIKFAYDHLPAEIKALSPLKSESKSHLEFRNGSRIWVTTSGRGEGLDFLHVSEYGDIAATAPITAKEIKSGAFPAVSPRGIIFVESTAKGQSGEFYDLCVQAQRATAAAPGGIVQDPMDWQFHFYPWWQHPDNEIDAKRAVVPDRLERYFTELRKDHKIYLSAGQKAWYAKAESDLGELMWREHPSHPEEAFKASLEGTIFRKQCLIMRARGGVCDLPYQPAYLVDTWWDLGVDDETAIIFTQTVGPWLHMIDYLEGSDEGFDYYLMRLRDRAMPCGSHPQGMGYRYGTHTWPHDGGHRQWGVPGAKTAQESALEMGFRVNVQPREPTKIDSINAGRKLFQVARFDAAKCEQLLVHLESYRKKWDKQLAQFQESPLHDEHSHAADAWQQLAMGHSFAPQRHDISALAQPVPSDWDRAVATQDLPSEAWT